MLRKEMIRHLEEILRKRRSEITQNIGRGSFFTRSIDADGSGDAADQAAKFEFREINAQVAGRDVEEIEKIDRALEKMREGEYGVCDDCGKLIGQDRLEALPFVTKCISCQKEEERFCERW